MTSEKDPESVRLEEGAARKKRTESAGAVYEAPETNSGFGKGPQGCRGYLEGIKLVDMVPNLSPQSLVSVEIGKDFMLSHDYIKNDFDVQKWAALEFLEQAARELREQQWKKATAAKLPEATVLQAATRRLC